MAKTKKWLRKVKTVSTAPPKDLFTKDAQTIAETMAKKSVSPKGIGSGVRMIQYFISRRQKSVGGAQAEARNSQEVAAKEKQPKTRSELELRQNQSSLRQPGIYFMSNRLRNRNLGTWLSRPDAIPPIPNPDPPHPLPDPPIPPVPPRPPTPFWF